MQTIQRPIKAIIFDHDGTLVDSESVHCACWNLTIAALSPLKKPPILSFADYCELFNGLPTRTTTARIAERFNLQGTHEAIYRHKINQLNTWLSKQPFALLPHVMAALEALKKSGIPMAIASGANASEVKRSVSAHALEPFFGTVATQDDVQHSKPAPDVYLLAAKRLGIAPEFCLAIEDSDTGYASAISAGMLCLRLTPNPTKPLEFESMRGVYEWLTNAITNSQLEGPN